MVDWITLLTFVPAALALILTPGADMMFCLGQGVRSGGRAAVAASAGVSAGSMVHVLIAGLGLGAVIASMPWMLDAIRWLGVAYLLWLARASLRAGPLNARGTGKGAAGLAQSFREGALVNLSNPKVILFVLAFLPQFIDPARGSVLGQFMILGMVIALGGFVINGAVGLGAGGLGSRLAASRGFARGLGYASATIFTALALRLALVQRG